MGHISHGIDVCPPYSKISALPGARFYAETRRPRRVTSAASSPKHEGTDFGITRPSSRFPFRLLLRPKIGSCISEFERRGDSDAGVLCVSPTGRVWSTVKICSQTGWKISLFLKGALAQVNFVRDKGFVCGSRLWYQFDLKKLLQSVVNSIF